MGILPLGFIGFGALGEYLGDGFAGDYDISFFDPAVNNHSYQKAERLTELVDNCSILLIATPASSFEEVIAELSKLNIQNKLIIDVLSTKTFAVDIYKKYLPASVDILSLHPLFGPPSYKSFEANSRIVSCYKKGDIADRFEGLLQEKYSFKIIHKTADAHDEHMAFHHALPFILAHALAKTDFNKDPGDLTIPSEEKLRKIVDIASKESDDLYFTIMRSNPYAIKAVQDMMKSLQSEQEILWA